MRVTLSEATAFAAAATPPEGSGRLLVQVITPGWGSSGYYSREVLEAAGRDKVWPAGTHMYIDHPSESEAYDRPERTVKDLAAVTLEDARWDPTANEGAGALVAPVRVFSQWRQALAEMADVIGVSIRGSAEGEMGEAEGRRGRVFTRLTEGASIDFVTKAGRGGRVLQVLESARTDVAEARNVGQWVESRIHRDFTVTADEMFGDGRLTREERITLSGAIGDALAAFVSRVETDAPGLYERDLWEEPTQGTPTVAEAATDVPSRPAGQSTTQESEEDTMPQIEEARLRQLETDAGRATVAESERAAAVARAETAERELAESKRVIAVTEARTKLRPTVAAVLNASESLPPVIRQRVTDQVVEALDADATEDSAKTAATEARTNAEAEAAAIAEMYGVGTPRGLGPSTPAPAGDVSEADLDRRSASVFGRTVKEA